MLLTGEPFLAEFDRIAQQALGGADSVGMPMDVIRRGEELLVRLDVPGVTADGVRLDLENHVLTVTAERHASYGEGEKVLLQERFDGSMTRRLRVPEWVDGERVTADLTDGVLTVVLPVAEQAKPRRIEIRPGSGQTSLSGRDTGGETAA